MKKTSYSRKSNELTKILTRNITSDIISINNAAADIINLQEQKSENMKKAKIKDLSIKKDNRELIDKYGNFYFEYYSQTFNHVSPQVLVRFLYLSCFMDYENYLKITLRRFMTFIDMRDILNLESSEFYKTKKSLIDNKLILVEPDDKIKVNPKYCIKGYIGNNFDSKKIRIFEETLKELYSKATPREHAQLALLYLLLPYISFSTNICCANPFEENIDKIELYTLQELAELLHQTNISRFKRRLLKMTVNGESVVCLLELNNTRGIVINPRVYYKGRLSGLEKMEGIGIIFTVLSNKENKGDSEDTI